MLLLWGSDEIITTSNATNGLLKYEHVEISRDYQNLPVGGKDDLIVAMGTKALATLTEHNITPKGRVITWCRYPRLFHKPMTTLDSVSEGIIVPPTAPYMVTFSPSIKSSDYAKYVDFRADIRLADRYMRTQTFQPQVGCYDYVTDFSSDISFIKIQYAKTGKPVDVALDLETLGLDPYADNAYIVAIQLSVESGMANVIPFTSAAQYDMEVGPDYGHTVAYDIYSQLVWLMNSPMVSLRGANLKYDLHWLHVFGGFSCTNFKFDTMLVGSLLDENRRNSLNTHAKWYLPELGGYDDEFDASHDKGRMDIAMDEDPEGFLQYAGGDTDACLQVSKLMKEELLQDPRLTSFYINLLHPAARAYEVAEQTGMLVDVEYYLELELELEEELEQLWKIGLSLLPWRIVNKHRESGNLNLTKAALIVDYMFSPMGANLKPKMFTPKGNAPSTAGEHLQMFSGHEKVGPFVQILQQYADIKKTLGTYVIRRDKEGNPSGGFLFHLRSDKRFHATHFLHNTGDGSGGTNTGRVSIRDPAMQTLPKHTKWAKKLRRAFIAPDGKLIMGNDYSQGELKIAACLANEVTMIEAYRGGADLHAITGARMAGMTYAAFKQLMIDNPPMFERLRQRAKAGNFGFLYGMGVEGFIVYAKASFGVIVTEQEATDAREAFFSTYPRLAPWHKAYKSFARANGYVRSPLGRVRHLPMIHSPFQDVSSQQERRAVNAPVQATLSDMTLWASALLAPEPDVEVATMIHDQLLSYVPEDSWDKAAHTAVQVMENLPFETLGWKPQLKFTVDCEVGPNMADMKKVNLAEAA